MHKCPYYNDDCPKCHPVPNISWGERVEAALPSIQRIEAMRAGISSWEERFDKEFPVKTINHHHYVRVRYLKDFIREEIIRALEEVKARVPEVRGPIAGGGNLDSIPHENAGKEEARQEFLNIIEEIKKQSV